MPKIQTIYLISHTHTDLGYTDYPDTVFRQHLDFIDKAIDLGEATADYPEDSRYKWTCEVTSFVERYLQERPAKQVDRFLELHKRGQMAVAAMQYHWTPLLSTASMIRSLLPVMRLRKDYGINLTTAMQCDVNGASWLWADLLPAIGINSFTMSINMHRGRRPEPDLNAFWWQGPGGNRLLTFNGPHYLYGLFRYGIGDKAIMAEKLGAALEHLEQREDYPYDFLYAQITHPARVDNGPPLPHLSDFIREWNESGGQPRMKFVTIDEFTKMLHDRYGTQLVTWQGDWADWWVDGAGSSLNETSLNRSTEELLPVVDYLSTQVNNMDPALLEEAYHLVSLYDEHSWGGFASIRRPHSVFSHACYNRKASFAFGGYGMAHDLLSTGGRELARNITGVVPEGDAWRRWGQYKVSDPAESPTSHHFLVMNTLPWERHVRWQLPPDMGGAAPYGILEMFLVGNYRERPPLEADAPPGIMVEATLPPFSYETVAYSTLEAPPDASTGEGVISNQWYSVEIDPMTGGLRSWYDKELGVELARQDGPWRLGQYIYEWVDHPDDRLAIFALDFDRDDFGVRYTDTPFRRGGPSEVEIMPARIEPDGIYLEARLQGQGARSIKIQYVLPHHHKALYLDMVIDKEHITNAEAVYIPFPLAIDNPQFHLDLNGVPLIPEEEQLNGSCRDWYGVHRWAEVGNKNVSVTVAPLDSPLIQVGGITTGRWAYQLNTDQATLVSWALNNHWDTNFKASQGEDTLLRYRLTSSENYDSAASSRFAIEAMVPPLIVRVSGAELGRKGQFMTVAPDDVAEVQVKRAADGNGLIVHAVNLTSEPQDLTLTFPTLTIEQVWQCNPIEDNLAETTVTDGAVTMTVPSRSVASLRILPA